MVTGLSTGGAFAAYSTFTKDTEDGYLKPLQDEYKTGHEKLEDLNETTKQMREAVKIVQEEVHTKQKRMENIFQAAYETKISANYLNSKLDPNFDNLKIAATTLAELCTDYTKL